jgi:peptide/nickel transport system permease protein
MQMGREAALPENKPKLEALRHQMGLDRPIPVQYLFWLRDLAHGNFGDSLRSRRPTLQLFTQKVPITLELVAVAALFALLVSLPAGVFAALRRGTLLDRTTIGFVSAGLAVPSFWLGLALILVFSVKLHWLPASGYVSPRVSLTGNLAHVIMPGLTLGVYLSATLTRFVRADMIETLAADYVRTARAKGLRERVVVIRHALRNALIPVLTIAGLEIGALLGGAVIIEQVFSWSGVGWLTVQAVFDRDYPLVQTSVLFIAVGLTLVNLVVDLGYGWLNPKLRVA